MKKNKCASSLGTLNLGNPTEKRDYNRRLFKMVAPAYQTVTSVLSFGQDKVWKSKLMSWLPQKINPVCVDLACGTGDLVALLQIKYGDGVVIGLDQSPEMMRSAKALPNGATLVTGDMNTLPLRDNCIDIVTGGYALRNAPDLDIAIAEIARILKPGGVAGFLDFSRPNSVIASCVELSLLRIWGSIWGAAFHRNKDVYGYIAKSLADFPDREALTERLMQKGLKTLKTAYPFFGFLELRLVVK